MNLSCYQYDRNSNCRKPKITDNFMSTLSTKYLSIMETIRTRVVDRDAISTQIEKQT